MSLTLDERHLLPPGVHDATLEEIERHLALSGRRKMLFLKLNEYVSGVRQTGWACQILIDGSFVMPKIIEPNDIDIILVLPADWDMTRTDFKPYEYNVLDKGHTKRAYKIEVFPVVSGSAKEQEFLELFARIREEHCWENGWTLGSLKGIVRVVQ